MYSASLFFKLRYRWYTTLFCLFYFVFLTVFWLEKCLLTVKAIVDKYQLSITILLYVSFCFVILFSFCLLLFPPFVTGWFSVAIYLDFFLFLFCVSIACFCFEFTLRLIKKLTFVTVYFKWITTWIWRHNLSFILPPKQYVDKFGLVLFLLCDCNG